MAKPKNSAPKHRRFYSIYPWECQHYADRSEISAYVEATGKFEVALTVHPTSGASPEALSVFITDLINDNLKNGNILLDAVAALELVLEEERLTFASEQAADAVVSRIKKRI